VDNPLPSLLLTESKETSSITIWGMPQWGVWLLIFVLLVFTGMFSASENAYTNCNKYHFRAEAEKGKLTGKIITHLVDKFDSTLVTILVCSNSVSTLMSYLSALLWYQIATANGWSHGIEALLSTVVMGFLFYVIADTLPKVVSKAIPDQMAVFMAYPLITLEFLLYPITLLFRGILLLVHKIFHLKDQNMLSKEDVIEQASSAVNEEVVLDEEENDKDKLFEMDETAILDNVMTFDMHTVRQVYTPLDKVFALDINGLTCEKVNEAIQQVDYSRIPVYDGEKSNIIGVLIVRNYFAEYSKDPHLSIPSILEKRVDIDIDRKLDDALDDLNSEQVHLGVVLEKGKVVGIVTMQEVLSKVISNIDEDPTLDPKEQKR